MCIRDRPDVDEVLDDAFVDGENLKAIKRKTKDNIVNINHELRAEEYSWWKMCIRDRLYIK